MGENEMKQFTISRQLFGEEIRAWIRAGQDGTRVSVSGGQLPHVGAVTVVQAEGECKTVQYPGHKDAAVSERWAQALAAAGYRPIMVEAGIHYDNLSREGIQAVLNLSEEMLAEALHRLQSES